MGKRQTGILLQASQLIHQKVIIPVWHNGIVVPVVGDVRLVELFNQLQHAGMVGLILIRVHAHSPYLCFDIQQTR